MTIGNPMPSPTPNNTGETTMGNIYKDYADAMNERETFERIGFSEQYLGLRCEAKLNKKTGAIHLTVRNIKDQLVPGSAIVDAKEYFELKHSAEKKQARWALAKCGIATTEPIL